MAETNPQRARIFSSYKRNVDPDEPVARQVYEVLRQHHHVFIDQAMLVGMRWAERIEAELRQADFLITFLSAESIHSEMIVGEIETAHRLAKEQGGRPGIRPVRLAYRDPFQYPLSAYLNPINWAFWQSHEDTPRLTEELTQAICGGALTIDEHSRGSVLRASTLPSMSAPVASAQPARLEMPEGTMDPQSSFYVERPGDRIALEAIERQGVTITISWDRTARVWDAASGREERTLRGHTERVTAIAFSPDRTRLATASADKLVRFYILDIQDLMGLARTRVTRSLTPKECRKYLNQPQSPPTP